MRAPGLVGAAGAAGVCPQLSSAMRILQGHHPAFKDTASDPKFLGRDFEVLRCGFSGGVSVSRSQWATKESRQRKLCSHTLEQYLRNFFIFETREDITAAQLHRFRPGGVELSGVHTHAARLAGTAGSGLSAGSRASDCRRSRAEDLVPAAEPVEAGHRPRARDQEPTGLD